MPEIRLGKTQLQISPLVFGTLPLGPLQANLSAEEGGRLIRHALQAGVNFLDTAELYGTYPHIRAALNDWKGEVMVATKTHAADGSTARSHVEKGLRELDPERFDVVHLHGARVADPFVERREVFAELLRMKEEGKIRHIGLSSHYITAIRKAAGQAEVEVLHPLLNRRGMGIIDGTAEQMLDAVRQAAAAGKGVYAMKVLAGGNLIQDTRESITWVRDQTGVHAMALGMLSTEEIDANLALLRSGQADESTWRRLTARRRRLHIMEKFCKGCGACVPACDQGGLQMVDDKATVDTDSCILCGYCAAACPEFLIRVV